MRLEVQMEVHTERKEGIAFVSWLTTNITFECDSRIVTDEKVYISRASETQRMGLGQILHDHYY